MTRFVFLSLLVLAFGFYELSGGSDFDPDAQREAALDARIARAAERNETIVAALTRPVSPDASAQSRSAVAETQEVAVTRSNLNLVAFDAATRVVTETAGPTGIEEPSSIARSTLSELATQVAENEAPLSLASLETDADTEQSNVFAGSSQVAQSASAIGASDIRKVKGDLVNLRSGPGTEYDVIDQLPQATEVEILSAGSRGWVELRIMDSNQTGWIAEFLLTGG